MPSGRSVYELQKDYLQASAQTGAFGRGFSKEQRESLAAYQRFVSSQSHKLAKQPQTLVPLAIAQALDSPVRRSAIERCAKGLGPEGPWFHRLNPPATDENPALLRVLEGHTGDVYSACISADGRWALSGSGDQTLRLWDLATGQEPRRFEEHACQVTSVCLSPDGRWALSGSGDQTLRLWDLATGQCLAVFPADCPVTCVAIGGRAPFSVAAGDQRGNVWFFRIEEGSEPGNAASEAHQGPCINPRA